MMRTAATLAGMFLSCAIAAPAASKPGNEDCLACHADSTLAKDVNGKPVSLHVDPDKFKNSLHGGMFTCVDCHTDVKSVPHQNPPAKVSCATCHQQEQTAYQRSLHARITPGAHLPAAVCSDCHGSPHELLASSDPQSRTNHAQVPNTCGGCHSLKFVMASSGGNAQPFISYQASVHGQAVARGVATAAVCTDCHGAHDILSAADPRSPIFKFSVPATCGKCHATVAAEFQQSIHGQALARGDWQAPVCTDCHGIHSIRSHKDPNSPVAAQNLAQEACARCHEGVRLSQEFDFESGRVTTYLASYHGLALQRGSTVVANCASCHGVHNILPSSDPRSSVNSANLVKTCSQCHRGITPRFVLAKVHVNAPLSADRGSIAVRWVRRLYLWLIMIVVGGMLAHNLIIWRFKAVANRRQRGAQTITRMSRSQRFQHNLLLISFSVLVVTGFALKFPDSWFKYLVLGMSEPLRGTTHRIAGAVLIAVSIYHLIYLLGTREGRSLLRNLRPGLRDFTAALRNMLYYLGLLRQKPLFGRFTYAEKLEYWALVWGTIVMAVTGVMLWAKVTIGNLLPRWWLDVATAVHFYEAVLATLAILIWHFYQVFFDPDAYPMNWSWWDGKVPLEHYRNEHALDIEALGGQEAAPHLAIPAGEENSTAGNDPGDDTMENKNGG